MTLAQVEESKVRIEAETGKAPVLFIATPRMLGALEKECEAQLGQRGATGPLVELLGMRVDWDVFLPEGWAAFLNKDNDPVAFWKGADEGLALLTPTQTSYWTEARLRGACRCPGGKL
jgi:hypothetical protein